MQSLAVLLLHVRHPYPAQHGGVAPVVRQQRTHHFLRVDPVCLVLLRLPVHQKARRIEHDRLKGPGTVEPTCQPKAFVARLVAVQNAYLMVENLFGLGSMALNQIPEGIDIRGFERVQADPIVHRALDPDFYRNGWSQ